MLMLMLMMLINDDDDDDDDGDDDDDDVHLYNAVTPCYCSIGSVCSVAFVG